MPSLKHGVVVIHANDWDNSSASEKVRCGDVVATVYRPLGGGMFRPRNRRVVLKEIVQRSISVLALQEGFGDATQSSRCQNGEVTRNTV